MQWKALDTDSEYEISDTGLVRKVHFSKQWCDRDGYAQVRITQQGQGKNCRVHRLVLHAFDPRPNEAELEVHHIDGNPANNCLENLQWVTHEENIKYISPEKLASSRQFIAQKVNQYDLDGNYIATYVSVNEAKRQTGCNGHHIGEVCQGKRKTCGGFKWQYFDGSTTNGSEKSHEAEDT